MSNLYSQLGYFTGEVQALQLIEFVVFGVVDYPLAFCVLVHVSEISFKEQLIHKFDITETHICIVFCTLHACYFHISWYPVI